MTRPALGRAVAAVGFVTTALAVSSCDGGRAVPIGGTAVVVYPGAPRVANPLVAADAYSLEVARSLLFLSLLEHGPDLALRPRLAESWDADGDTAAVFRLRRDVRWTDGAPTTAYDVAFTVERALDPATGYPNRGQLEHVRDVVAVDSFTVRARFHPVRGAIDPIALLPVLPRHVLDTVPANGMQHAHFNMRPVTNGPFAVGEVRARDRWAFVANEAFPESLGGRPRLDRVVWRAVPESAAQIAELRAGDADVVVGVRHDAFERLGSAEGIRAMERPTLSYAAIAWNGRRPPLDDPRVRRALTLAMNRAGMVQALRGGHGQLAAGPVPPDHWAHSDRLEPLPYDPEAANAELAAALGGRPLRFTLLIPAGSDFNRDLAQVIQADLARVGVTADLRALEFATLVQIITGPARDFDAVLLALDADARLDLRSLFHSGAMDGPFQVAGYSNPALDSVLDAIDAETAREPAGELWDRAQALVAADQPWTFLYFVTDLILVRSRLEGVEADLRGVLHSAHRWWISEADPTLSRGDATAPAPAPRRADAGRAQAARGSP
jgi:peptide/nickel transport system substrate-binding protein